MNTLRKRLDEHIAQVDTNGFVMTTINSLINEGKLSQFRVPFVVTESSIADSNGKLLITINNKSNLTRVADILNSFMVKEAKQLDESAGDRMRQDAQAMKREGDMIGYHKQMIKYAQHMEDAEKFNLRNTGRLSMSGKLALKNIAKFKKMCDENRKDLAALQNIKEASELNDMNIEDMEDRRTAEQLEVGDVVEITGNVNFQDSVGEIARFGADKRFVVVKLYGGGEHSFHSSDVSEASPEDDDNEKESQEFYVAFYDRDENYSWIGRVTQEDGGGWREKPYKGEPESRWGGSYMSYLSPQSVMSWINKDYSRGMEVEGPFMSAEEAEEYVEHNWGKLEEGLTYTNYSDWKQAVLLSYPVQADKIKFRGRMEGEKTTISAVVPGEERVYGMWEDDTFKGTVLTEANWGSMSKRQFKQAELEHELGHEDREVNRTFSYVMYGINIDGKPWMKDGKRVEFKSKATAEKSALTISARGKKAVVVPIDLTEAFKINDKVKIVSGPKGVVGKEGFIGEIRTDVAGKKKYTIDYDGNEKTQAKSIMLSASQIRSVK